MIMLVLGLVLFLGIHSVVLFAPDMRDRLIQQFGKLPYRTVHSIGAIVGLGLIAHGYAAARMDPLWLWIPPFWMNHINLLLTVFAAVFVGAALVPGSWIKAKTGAPMLLAIKTWAFGHLLCNGGLHDVLLFGSFLAWGVVGYIIHRKRDRANGVVREGKIARDSISVVIGLALWAAFAFWLHALLIGIAPMPM